MHYELGYITTEKYTCTDQIEEQTLKSGRTNVRNASKGEGGKQSVTAPSFLYYKMVKCLTEGERCQNFGNLRYVMFERPLYSLILKLSIIS